MGYVTNDPRKSDDVLPGASGLMMDLGLMACPRCRREAPRWEDTCPDCGVQVVARSTLGGGLPEIPAHLLGDDPDEAQDDEDAEDEDGDQTPA